MNDEFSRRLADCGTQLLILRRLLGKPGEPFKCSFATFRAIKDILRGHGQYFESEALDAAKRGSRSPILERLALAFGQKELDLDWLPDAYLKKIVSSKGHIDDGNTEGIAADPCADDEDGGRSANRNPFSPAYCN